MNSIGLIHADDEDGDKSYIFNMSILDIDLDEVIAEALSRQAPMRC